jgi:hypothetical protein
MQKPPSQNLPPEVLISCLDVLCRANATVFESDPKLAADIAQAIESLSTALQCQEQPAATAAPAMAMPMHDSLPEPLEYRKTEYGKKEVAPDYLRGDDAIVDVLTNEIIRKPSKK